MGFISFSPFPVLASARLILRKLDFSDADGIFALRSHEDYSKYTGIKRYTSKEEATAYINKINGEVERNNCAVWAILTKEHHEFIGSVCLWNIIEDERAAEIGYDLLPAFRGKGYIQEAMEALIQYGFEEIELQKIFAFLRSDHVKSVKVLERMGFMRKFVKEEKWEDGNEHEMAMYELYAHEIDDCSACQIDEF